MYRRNKGRDQSKFQHYNMWIIRRIDRLNVQQNRERNEKTPRCAPVRIVLAAAHKPSTQKSIKTSAIDGEHESERPCNMLMVLLHWNISKLHVGFDAAIKEDG
ncbi:hypothetical protein RRG08_010013 [Elysia crispata]|uniref:Uncharacterized protein n=1 Tax=Elysia crispata TaxID=231223 RepID=A0AAE0YPU2_9GAST|nr:hypothetical protein RRG08_010013 [Elysia crispata]